MFQARILLAVAQGQESADYGRWPERFLLLQKLCIEHSIALEAELQLAMLLEFTRLKEMRENKEKNLWGKVDGHLDFLDDKSLDGYVSYDKNKAKFYRQLEDDVQEIFLDFMNRVPRPEKREVARAIKEYLAIVERNNGDEINVGIRCFGKHRIF